MCITFHYARYCQQDSCFLLEKMAFQAMWRKPAPARHGFAAPVRLTARCVPRSVMHLGRLVRWMGGKGSEHKLQYIYIYYLFLVTVFSQNFTRISGHLCWRFCSFWHVMSWLQLADVFGWLSVERCHADTLTNRRVIRIRTNQIDPAICSSWRPRVDDYQRPCRWLGGWCFFWPKLRGV